MGLGYRSASCVWMLCAYWVQRAPCVVLATFGTWASNVPSTVRVLTPVGRGSSALRLCLPSRAHTARPLGASPRRAPLTGFSGPLQRQRRESTRHGPLPDPLCAALGLVSPSTVCSSRFLAGLSGLRALVGFPPFRAFSSPGAVPRLRGRCLLAVRACKQALDFKALLPR